MRDAMAALAATRSGSTRCGRGPRDRHSVQVDFFGSATSLAQNSKLEFERNTERFEFLRWGQSAFQSLRVVPPATGIVHQVNLEYLARSCSPSRRAAA